MKFKNLYKHKIKPRGLGLTTLILSLDRAPYQYTFASVLKKIYEGKHGEEKFKPADLNWSEGTYIAKSLFNVEVIGIFDGIYDYNNERPFDLMKIYYTAKWIKA